jgi:hypothetical protein
MEAPGPSFLVSAWASVRVDCLPWQQDGKARQCGAVEPMLSHQPSDASGRFQIINYS